MTYLPATDEPNLPGLPRFETRHRAGNAGSARVLAWHLGRTVARLAFMGLAAMAVGRLVMQQPVDGGLVAAAALCLGLASAIGFAADRAQVSAEADIATALREAVAERLSAMPARQVQAIPAGRLVIALQRYPQAVAALAVGHRVAARMMAVGPLLAAAALLAVSWQAALTMLALTPVMILFFALVGDTIRKRAQQQEQAFGHLAGQFADRIRTLPTILANHAVEHEEAKLSARLRTYADRTMAVLRIAFLNAAIIDFFASLSIAMLAVFLGLGHLGLAKIPGFSDLQLWQSLFILMIAPDYYAPFRRFAEQYHAKAEGEAAAAGLDEMLSPVPAALPPVPTPPLLEGLPSRGLVVIAGPSGSGKTTLLRRLAGTDEATILPEAGLSWVSTDSFVPAGTLGEAVAWRTGVADAGAIRRITERLGLLDIRHLPLGLDTPLPAGGTNLSGGQRMRLALARALLGGRTILADEPTAKLDAATAAAVRDALRTAAHDRLVIVATHDPLLSELADLATTLPARAPEERPA